VCGALPGGVEWFRRRTMPDKKALCGDRGSERDDDEEEDEGRW